MLRHFNILVDTEFRFYELQISINDWWYTHLHTIRARSYFWYVTVEND